MVATTCENRPAGFLAVPLNIRCSRKCASPDLPGVSSAEPTRYQIMWVTTGARWSGMTTTSRPFGRVKWEIWGALAAAGAMVPAAFATKTNAAMVVRNWRKTVVPQTTHARIVAGGLAKHRLAKGGSELNRGHSVTAPSPPSALAHSAVFDGHRLSLLILRPNPVGLL